MLRLSRKGGWKVREGYDYMKKAHFLGHEIVKKMAPKRGFCHMMGFKIMKTKNGMKTAIHF
jgi:hypothetical protein